MTILADWEIKILAINKEMIEPFISEPTSEENDKKIISKGLSTFGYDITLGNVFKAYTSAYSAHQTSDKWSLIVDPLDFDTEHLLEEFTVTDSDHIVIPPHGYFLGYSNEYIKMPDNVSALCLTKSTYARVGILCNTTPLEAGWEGQITLEIANLIDRPVKLYINQGICQLQFFEGENPNTTYAEKKGKYQFQTGITTAKG